MSNIGGKKGNSLSLNLTPMLDIFSILVTFLLMSYSTDPVTHEPDKNVELPGSATLVNLDEVPAIVVTKDSISINGKKVTDIVGGDVPQKDQDQGAIRPVYESLKIISEQGKKVFARAGQEEKGKSQTITMEMHKEHRYKLVKRIMLSAEQADFIKFKLVVSKDEKS